MDRIIAAAASTADERPDLYAVLKLRLQREPTHRELCEEVRRILSDALVERATAGKLAYQRKG